MRLRVRPPDDRLSGLVGQLRLELAAHLLGSDDDHVQATRVAQGPVDLAPDRLQVVQNDVLDMALVARLRPTTLVVLAGHLLGLVDELLEATFVQPVDHPSLARDHGDERSVAVSELGGERRNPQLRPENARACGPRECQ